MSPVPRAVSTSTSTCTDSGSLLSPALYALHGRGVTSDVRCMAQSAINSKDGANQDATSFTISPSPTLRNTEYANTGTDAGSTVGANSEDTRFSFTQGERDRRNQEDCQHRRDSLVPGCRHAKAALEDPKFVEVVLGQLNDNEVDDGGNVSEYNSGRGRGGPVGTIHSSGPSENEPIIPRGEGDDQKKKEKQFWVDWNGVERGGFVVAVIGAVLALVGSLPTCCLICVDCHELCCTSSTPRTGNHPPSSYYLSDLPRPTPPERPSGYEAVLPAAPPPYSPLDPCAREAGQGVSPQPMTSVYVDPYRRARDGQLEW